MVVVDFAISHYRRRTRVALLLSTQCAGSVSHTVALYDSGTSCYHSLSRKDVAYTSVTRASSHILHFLNVEFKLRQRGKGDEIVNLEIGCLSTG